VRLHAWPGRNLCLWWAAAHDYETDYDKVALHFNALQELTPDLFAAARRFVDYCAGTLGVNPLRADFDMEFIQITSK